MYNILFWLYLSNSVLLINHEIDSAYWKEWDLFRLPGGISLFLLLHFPLLALVIYGLVLVSQHSFSGLLFSLALSLAGVFAFAVHMYFIRKGRPEFNAPVSLFILYSTLFVSLAQGGLTVYLLTS